MDLASLSEFLALKVPGCQLQVTEEMSKEADLQSTSLLISTVINSVALRIVVHLVVLWQIG